LDQTGDWDFEKNLNEGAKASGRKKKNEETSL
jgi:hypothetical protein